MRLCNFGNLAKSEFAAAHAYFKSRVDQDYTQFYSRSTADFVWYVAGALIIWAGLLLAGLAIRWIAAAPAEE